MTAAIDLGPAPLIDDPEALRIGSPHVYHGAKVILQECLQLLEDAASRNEPLSAADAAVVMVHRHYPHLPKSLIERFLPESSAGGQDWWVMAATRQQLAVFVAEYDPERRHQAMIDVVQRTPEPGSFWVVVFSPEGCTCHRVRFPT